MDPRMIQDEQPRLTEGWNTGEPWSLTQLSEGRTATQVTKYYGGGVRRAPNHKHKGISLPGSSRPTCTFTGLNAPTAAAQKDVAEEHSDDPLPRPLCRDPAPITEPAGKNTL